jgi:catechol 2,3-dioxygenase-like lactoylglutathione lyase family enzyme
MQEEIYPMPSFVTLTVSDLEMSSAFYQDVLGFKHIFTMPGPGGQPALVHLRWAKYADVLIAKPRGSELPNGPKGAGVSLNFNLTDQFNGDLDAFAAQARAQGAQVTGPVVQPWNVREVTITDLDGYRLIFTAPVNIGLSFDKVIQQAAAIQP